MLQRIYRLDRFAAHDVYHILIGQIVTPFDRVKGVPFPHIFLKVTQGRADAALGSTGVGARRVQLADDGCAGMTGQLQSGHQAGATRADDDCII